MKEFIPISKPQRPSEPTAFDMSIYHYQCKVVEFYNKKAKARKSANKENLQQIMDDQDRDWKHLMAQRRTIQAQIKAKEGLDSYRQENLTKSLKSLQEEKHHPTTLLAKHLAANGEPKPTKFHQAHHIIPGKGHYRKSDMVIVRLNLHTFGIGINDPMNGVWLTDYLKNKPGDWATPESPAHRQIHRHNYEHWLNLLLGNDNISEDIFLGRLREIKRKLKTGTYPTKIIEDKDVNWTGE